VVVDINPAGDLDCYSLEVAAPSVLRASATVVGCPQDIGRNDPDLYVYDGAGEDITGIGVDDGGDGFCALFEKLVEPGTYVVCAADSGNNGTIENVTLTISAATQEVLAAGATCDPDSLAAVCDSDADLLCLLSSVEPEAFTCGTRTVLPAGADCVAGVETAVCDQTRGLSCIEGRCVNPAEAACDASQQIVGTSFTGTIPEDSDLLRSSCDFSADGRSEVVLTYAVQAPIANVSFSIPFGSGFVLSARSDCLVDDTELACRSGTGASVVVNGLTQGTVVSLVVEGPDLAEFTLSITEQPVQLLGRGETCRTASTTQICDSTQSLACEVGATAGEGTCETVTTEAVAGALTANDVTWDRPGVDFAAPFVCEADSFDDLVPFDSYLITNNESTELRVTIFQSSVGAVEACTADLFLHVFSSAVDPANPLAGCVTGDDDDGPDRCGQLDSVVIPANGSIVAVVSSYSDSSTLPVEYQLNVVAFGSFTVSAP
jgi:hypothetical protein